MPRRSHPPPFPRDALIRSVRSFISWTSCFVLLLAVPTSGQAQPDDRAWLGAGLGVGTLFDGDGVEDDIGGALGGVLYASYQSGVHVFSLRAAAAGEFVFGDTFIDVGLLYGRARPGRSSHASLSVGLALVFGERRCDGFLFVCSSEEGVEFADEVEYVVTVGLPVEAQLFWRPTSFGGFGLYGFANLNREASFVGATVGLQLGDLR